MGRCLALSPPFTAKSRTLRLDIGAVDGRASCDRTGRRKRFEHTSPETLAGPAVETVIDRRVRTILFRTINPAASCLQHMDDPGNHPPIIDPSRTGLVLRHERFNRCPLLIGQPKQSAHTSLHRPFDGANHDLQLLINGLIGFGA